MSVRNPFAFDNRRLDLVEEARRVEVGTPAFPGIFALGAAIGYLQGIGIDRIAARVLELNSQLTERLERAGFEVLSPDGAYRSAQTLCAIPESRRAAAFLQENGILVTVKPEGVRISTHFFNSEEELEACVRGLAAFRESLAVKG
jgi:cysteine desulfurase/selenocysteine lyase